MDEMDKTTLNKKADLLLDFLKESLSSLNDKPAYLASDIIKDQKNRYKILKNLSQKAGVYVFLDGKNAVYVGVGGTTPEHGLNKRIRQETKKYGKGIGCDTGATLSKNIQEIERTDAEGAKAIIETLAINTLIVGCSSDLDDRHKAQLLEKFLISLLNPKYNVV